MNIIILMIPLSFLILGGAVWAFFWAVNNDQFDDMDSPGLLPMSDERDEDEVYAEESTANDSRPRTDKDRTENSRSGDRKG